MSTAQDIPKVWTILEMIRWGTGYFEGKGIDSPRLTMELIVGSAMKYERMQLYLNFDRPLSLGELDKIRTMVRRRAKREPLQYILGKTGFYGLEISVNPSVLIPRPETELLVEYVIKQFLQEKGKAVQPSVRILDIGTGSGCIALALAKHLPCEIDALDSSASALETAADNARMLGLQNVRFELHDILKNTLSSRFDVIVSNPPYIAQEEMSELEPELRNYEPSTALTDCADGLTFYRRFAELFPSLLLSDGFFCLEVGYEQAEKVQALFELQGFATGTFRDYAGIARGVFGRWKK